MSGTVGKQLQEARLKRSYSLEQAAHATHIRIHYLRALEEENFSVLPSPAQTRGFLRVYASYLGLDAGELLKKLADEYPTLSTAAPTHPGRENQKAPVSCEQADAIFAEIGQKLYQQRELLGLSLEDVEHHTHLRAHYLQALESGNLNGLPSPVQGRGMLNNYANFLGLNPEPLLLRYAEGLQARLATQRTTRPIRKPARPARPKAQPSSLRRLISTDFLIGGVVILFLGGFVLWSSLRVSAMRSQASRNTVTLTAPSIADILLNNETSTPSPSMLAPTPSEAAPIQESFSEGNAIPMPQETTLPEETIAGQTSAPTSPPEPGGAPVQIYLVIRQRAWMRILVDGKLEFEGRVTPGRAYTFQGKERVEILTGNGAAFQVFYNQIDMGVLGSIGEVLHRIFTVEGVWTPTATLTFTPLPTLQFTPSPSPSSAPGSTHTATLRP